LAPRGERLNRCEQAKISLSTADDAPVFVPNYLAEEGLASRVELTVYRHELEALTEDLVQKGMSSIDRLLELADVSDAEIEFVLATGGMVQMPVIRRRLRERFGPARVPDIVDANELIAKGAAWIAHDQQRVRLSKPLEVLLANNATTSLVGPEVDLPVRDQEQRYELYLRCVDPRDGFARIQFTRPVRPGRVQPTDDRLPYSTLLLPVNSTADPLLERLIVEVHIDHDFVVRVAARSKLTGEAAAAEIHGLEFGLALSNGA
jgi:hypothetical protein